MEIYGEGRIFIQYLLLKKDSDKTKWYQKWEWAIFPSKEKKKFGKTNFTQLEIKENSDKY